MHTRLSLVTAVMAPPLCGAVSELRLCVAVVRVWVSNVALPGSASAETGTMRLCVCVRVRADEVPLAACKWLCAYASVNCVKTLAMYISACADGVVMWMWHPYG